MNSTMQKNEKAESNGMMRNKTMLDAMYKNVKMGSDSLIDIMDKAKDKAFREEITAEVEEYEKYAKQVATMIRDNGDTPKEENIVAKMGAKMGMAMNTLTDSSTSHLAQMVIEGATMGTTELTRLIREHENTNCSESTLKLARDIVKYEESTIESMKKFL